MDGPYYPRAQLLWDGHYPPPQVPDYEPAHEAIYEPNPAVGANFYDEPTLTNGPIVHEGFVPQPDIEDEEQEGEEDEEDESLSMLPLGLKERFGNVLSYANAPGATNEGTDGSEDALSNDENAFLERAIAAADNVAIDPDYGTSSAQSGSEENANLLSGDDMYADDTQRVTGRGQRGRGRGRGRVRGQDNNRGPGRSRGRGRRRGRPTTRGIARGRVSAEQEDDSIISRRGRPRGSGRARKKRRNHGGVEFQRLQNLATDAFLNARFEEALEHAQQAVQTNPDIFASHNLLSEVLMGMNRKEDSLNALLSGAHTKRDPKLWWHVADRTLDLCGDRRSILGQAYYCYSQVIKLDKDDLEARAERLKIQIELEDFSKARREAEMLLKVRNDDIELLRQFAELCATTGEVGKAVKAYSQAIEKFTRVSTPENSGLTWSVLNVYLDLLDQLDQHDEGVLATRRFSRWLLHRGHENYWDDQAMDAEWDIDDEPRRITVEGFVPEEYQKDQYGSGLPLEIRVRLGLFRVGQFRIYQDQALLQEAYRHFEHLNPRDGSFLTSLTEYDDLWKEVGDALFEAGEHTEAYRYYSAIQELNDRDPDFLLALASCHAALGRGNEARNILEDAASEHRGNIPIHLKLVKIYEALGRKREAVELAHKVTRLRSRQRDSMPSFMIDSRLKQRDGEVVLGETRRKFRGSYLKQSPLNRQQLLEQGQVRYMAMRELFSQMLSYQNAMEQSHADALEEWLQLAEQLIEDFRSMACFYPAREKWKFTGYRMTWATEAEVRVVMDELGHELDDLPNSLHDIHFDDWVDIFCRCSVTYAKKALKTKCEDVIKAALEANIFIDDPKRLARLHVCYLTCGVILGDEEIIYLACRHFFKEQPFAEETYRLFNASSRLYDGSRSWYNSGPSQKAILRAIKEMDYALLSPAEREAFEFSGVERNMYTKSGTDMVANPHGLVGMSTALLTTYGHVLAAGGAYPSALNYYFRAWTLKPDDPMLSLSIASAYIQHGMKRQSENRQYLVQQGLAFLFHYRELRGGQGAASIYAQEAEYNVGRMLSLLGLQNLAIECFQSCLALSAKVRTEAEARENAGEEVLVYEDFASQAAYALQTIASVAGDVDEARDVTRRWLVI